MFSKWDKYINSCFLNILSLTNSWNACLKINKYKFSEPYPAPPSMNFQGRAWESWMTLMIKHGKQKVRKPGVGNPQHQPLGMIMSWLHVSDVILHQSLFLDKSFIHSLIPFEKYLLSTYSALGLPQWKQDKQPWPVWLGRLGVIQCTERLQSLLVQFQVRAQGTCLGCRLRLH